MTAEETSTGEWLEIGPDTTNILDVKHCMINHHALAASQLVLQQQNVFRQHPAGTFQWQLQVHVGDP